MTRRLTRDEQRAQTRQRLLDSAEALFATQGIGETSIEQIAENAGYSRGAFYSNFADREALVLELMERRQDRNMAEAAELAGSDISPAEFLQRLVERSANQSHVDSTIGMEYILYAAHNPASRPRMKELNDRMLEQQTAMVRAQFAQRDLEMPLDAEYGAKILIALDEGFGLLRTLDPDGYPATMWADTVAFLDEAVVALIEKRSTTD